MIIFTGGCGDFKMIVISVDTAYYRIEKKIRKCPGCNVVKEATSFHRNRTNKTGLADYCKNCTHFTM